MRRHRARFLPLAAAGAVTALVVAACSSSSSASSTSSSSAHPITVGISLPLTGQFSADGIATEHGYQLWASDVNTNGGLLGRPVRLDIVNDNSNPKTVTTNYTTLITQDHVDLTMAPFSTLLTESAIPVTRRYGYALAAGSATGPAVFSLGDPYLFSVSVPDAEEMTPFATWVASLPAGKRPTTAGYAMVNDPFADPPVITTAQQLSQRGIKTVFDNASDPVNPNATDSNLIPVANRLAAKNPQLVVLGTVDVPSLLEFVHAFEAKGFNPQMIIATSGPDQGEEFLHHIEPANAEGIMVPDGWYGGEANALSHVMVQDYIAKFGGTTSDINADVAEAYSAGETLADAVTATHSTTGRVLAGYLHSHTVQTVQGPAQFNLQGKNIRALGSAFIFQWQNSQFLQVLPTGSGSAIEVNRPRWAQGG
ncbi:MAG TPA: ABC transporter substrate-binding protein [Streptosporangiaceae bacterium]|nr:ABC transporter substrate-binding protein [Streptosporangiaceae bacterium]